MTLSDRLCKLLILGALMATNQKVACSSHAGRTSNSIWISRIALRLFGGMPKSMSTLSLASPRHGFESIRFLGVAIGLIQLSECRGEVASRYNPRGAVTPQGEQSTRVAGHEIFGFAPSQSARRKSSVGSGSRCTFGSVSIISANARTSFTRRPAV